MADVWRLNLSKTSGARNPRVPPRGAFAEMVEVVGDPRSILEVSSVRERLLAAGLSLGSSSILCLPPASSGKPVLHCDQASERCCDVEISTVRICRGKKKMRGGRPAAR